MLKPSFEEFCELAEKGNLIPVYQELLMDLETPLSFFKRLDKDRYAFLLESVEGSERWARYWLDVKERIGSNLDPVVEATCRILAAARAAQVPILFTTFDHDPSEPSSPHDRKLKLDIPVDAGEKFTLDPRLQRRPTEKIIRKRYASAFKGTNLHEILTALGTDTLIVTGISTSHCVYATCLDATDSYRVIVPREAVGERCELFHEVNLLDIELDLGDVVPLDAVLRYLGSLPTVS